MSEEVPVFQYDGINWTGQPALSLTVNPTASLIFGNGATISWESGKLTFKGEMDEAAKMFFESFLKEYIDEYIKDTVPKDNLDYLEFKSWQREKHG